ncbi:nucleotidyltransferase domain-containing protein [uncultured Alcanivorax sp.]|jgi:hypothetical protein
MDISELSRLTTEWARDIPEISVVMLYGSRAVGGERPDSDWDICCVLNGSVEAGWYGVWFQKADVWKESFCKAVRLPFESVQFVASTSDQVVNGLLNGCRVLYVQRNESN